jgi:DNA-binding CsgD family transcriptional regulator
MEIENLNQEVLRLKKILDKDEFSEDKLEELINYVHLNDIIFLEKFDYFFPDFRKKIIAMTDLPLSVSEFKLCAMLKLGFSTKQIAIYTNSTIKSVEGKKYRLRKKLHLSSNSDNKLWFAEI